MKTKIQLQETAIITDPCYSPQSKHNIRISNMLPGTYNVVMEEDFGKWGRRVVAVTIWHENTTPTDVEEYDTFMVDSGQAGISDYHYYETKFSDEWYDTIQTYHMEKVRIDNADTRNHKKLYTSLYGKVDNNGTVNEAELMEFLELDKRLRDSGILNLTGNPFRYEAVNDIDIKNHKCAFTSTGYGDGEYVCYVHKTNGFIDGVVLKYS